MSNYRYQIALFFIFPIRKCQVVILTLVFQFPFSGFLSDTAPESDKFQYEQYKTVLLRSQLRYCHGDIKISLTGLTD